MALAEFIDGPNGGERHQVPDPPPTRVHSPTKNYEQIPEAGHYLLVGSWNDPEGRPTSGPIYMWHEEQAPNNEESPYLS